MDYECLDQRYSTTRLVTRMVPTIEVGRDSKYVPCLFIDSADGREGEGGLRTKGFYKVRDVLNGKPLITVVMAVLNGSACIEGAILSVITQTYDQIEFIVIDGVSTDGTLDTIRRFEHAIDYWVSEPDAGIYDALNKGIALAQGEWICVLGADDYFFSSDVLERMATHLVTCSQTIKLVYGSVAMISGEKQLCLLGEDWDKAKLQLHKTMSVPYPGLMHRRSWFQSYGLYDTTFRIVGDYEMLLRGWPREDGLHVPDLVMVGMRTGGVSNSSHNAELSNTEKLRAQEMHGIVSSRPERIATAAYGVFRFMVKSILGENMIWRLHALKSSLRPYRK